MSIGEIIVTHGADIGRGRRKEGRKEGIKSKTSDSTYETAATIRTVL